MYRKSREMIIVPDETQIAIEEFRETVTMDVRHGRIIEEFSELYNVGLTPSIVGVEEGNYNGYMWSVPIAKLGHIAIQKEIDMICIYLPDVITDNQYQYLKKHKKEYSIYKNSMIIVSVNVEDNQFILESFDGISSDDEIKMTDILYDKVEEKHSHNKEINK